MGLHHLNSPLKIRGQVLPPRSAGVMIFWGRSQLRVFASSWQIKVLPSRQVSGDDSCRRINSAVIKIRLFKPKKFSMHELIVAWKAKTFITAGRRPADKDATNIRCLKGRTIVAALINIFAGKNKPTGLKFLFLYFPFLYFLLILNCQLYIIHYIITPPCLRQYPSYLKRGVIMGLHHHLNSPLKIRGQVLPPGSTGLWYFFTSDFSTSYFFPSFLNCQFIHYPLSISS